MLCNLVGLSRLSRRGVVDGGDSVWRTRCYVERGECSGDGWLGLIETFMTQK
jgi:hypothetical protein